MYMYEEQNNKSTLKSTFILHVQRLWYNNDEPTFMKHLLIMLYTWLISMIHGLIDVYYIKHQRLQLIDISWIPVQAYST